MERATHRKARRLREGRRRLIRRLRHGGGHGYQSSEVGVIRIAVQAGDTLRRIAGRVYGNENLWYVLAEANALGADTELTAGTTIKVPDVKVTANDANTFKPFDPNEAIGSTTPSLPFIQPPPKNHCSGLAKVISLVVSVIVTYFTTSRELGAMAGNYAGQMSQIMLNGDYDWGRALRLNLNPFGGNREDLARSVYDPGSHGAPGMIDYKSIAISGASAYATQGVGEWAQAIGAGTYTTLALQTATSYATNYQFSKWAGYDVSWSNRQLGANIGAAFAGQAMFHGSEVETRGDATASTRAPVTQGDQAFSWTAAAAAQLKEAARQFVKDFGQNLIRSGIQYGAEKAFGVEGASWNWRDVSADAFGNSLGNAIAGGLDYRRARQVQLQLELQELSADNPFAFDGIADRFGAWGEGDSSAQTFALNENDPVATEPYVDMGYVGPPHDANGDGIHDERDNTLDSLFGTKGNRPRWVFADGEGRSFSIPNPLGVVEDTQDFLKNLKDIYLPTFGESAKQGAVETFTSVGTWMGEEAAQLADGDLEKTAFGQFGIFMLSELVAINKAGYEGTRVAKFVLDTKKTLSYYAEHPQEFVDGLLAEADEWWTSRTPVERAAELGTFAGTQGAEAGMMWGAGKVARVALEAPSALKALRLRRGAAASKARTFDFKDVEAFSKAANDPTPNATYRFNGVTWKTDRLGRVESVEGRFRHMPAGRDRDLQKMIGYNGPETDVGFHLWPANEGGPVNMLNVVPGNGRRIPGGPPNLNNGAWGTFERELRLIAKSPSSNVRLRIFPKYSEGNMTRRPDFIQAEFQVNDGAWVPRRFTNIH